MTTDQDAPGAGDPLDRVMGQAERVVYAAIALLLLAAALIALVAIGYEMATGLDEGALKVVESALSGLLLVFIFVELLGAVRATIIERKLVAEPFLVVGIIAAIKGILVGSLEAASLSGDELESAVMEIVGLGLVVLFLALAGFLVRRKEREPLERDD
ncbi:phosphate-starvation-inducible PsiE family protein [Aquihabitans daechungensis]|uniref:phosphate-starvation-inducible PsiE family protein n=1 Tax=Aquihabitans daechungensis TaxID=1052257 RepID=UPI003B9DF6D0